jgi:predicted Zn-dependent protease with MMP-like domain
MELEPEGIVPPDDDHQAGRDPVLAGIERLLDEGEVDAAWRAIQAARKQGQTNSLDLDFLSGDTCLAIGQVREAEAWFRRVLAVDPDCPASRCWLAMALFLQWRFDEAEVAVAAARAMPDAIIDVHVVEGMLLEHRGKFLEADACFATAAELGPEKYRLPTRLTRQQFDREVRKAARKLPRQFRQALDRVPVVVQDLPHAGLADDGDSLELPPDILGLFEGVPLPDTEAMEVVAAQPNCIYLFQRNLERAATDPDDLIAQIEITLYHELGHYLGFEEEDMDNLGLA